MTVCDIVNFMETVAPKELAEDWDNVGLLVGDPAASVEAAVVVLDITREAIAFAKEVGAQILIAHHPLIFSPVKRLVGPSALYQLASSGIAAFAAHTNLDVAAGGVNDVLAQRLGLVDVQEAFGGIGRVGVLPRSLSPSAFAALVKDTLHTPVQLREGSGDIRTVAIVGGAGGDFLCEVSADAFLTGEVKHHEWLDAPHGLTVVAAGHYATEDIIVDPLCERLSAAFETLKVYPFHGCAPYQTV